MVAPRADAKGLPVAGITGKSLVWVPDMTHSRAAQWLTANRRVTPYLKSRSGSFCSLEDQASAHSSSSRSTSKVAMAPSFAKWQHAFIERGGHQQHVPTASIPDCGCSLLNRGFGFYEKPLHQLGGGHHVVDQSHRLSGEWEEVVAAAGSESGQQVRSYSCGINTVGVGLELTDEG